jgi:NADPH:quinone reductase-like Zn-dependent oxidoreductase
MPRLLIHLEDQYLFNTSSMAEGIPELMRALALSRYGTPSTYDNASLPTPKIEKADEVLIKVKAASINPIDVKLASGQSRLKASYANPIPFLIYISL